MHDAMQHQVTEWSYRSAKAYANPFRDVQLDVILTAPDGAEQTVPAFWSGENQWRVRYAAAQVGQYTYRTVCSDTANAHLHGQEGTVQVAPYEGTNPLLRHGPLGVSGGRRHLEHADGTPFFWLADTWWMGLCQRWRFPSDFQRLVADRVDKGFNVIQIVAGLYPDMPAFDPRGANEAGWPWTQDYQTINPAYFDAADLRIDYLVSRGLLPCLVGAWGYHLMWTGVDTMKLHWRHLIARYGAYPMAWCLAGEGAMPYYLSETKAQDAEAQKQGWTEMTAYVRSIDPYHHPVTVHPSAMVTSREQIEDPTLLDFEMLQTGHEDRASLKGTVHEVRRSYRQAPPLPVINSECCYEGIGAACREEVQRLMFWASVLNGAAGYSYGANGVWQVNGADRPYGPSPHGMSWGDAPWQEAYQWPGSTHVGLAKRLLERFAWWRFEPHPEWVEPHWSDEDYLKPYAAGIPGKVRVIFWPSSGALPCVKGVESDVAYRAFLWNPTNGSERDLGTVQAEASGDWRIPLSAPPIFQDWVLVLHTDDAMVNG